MNTLTQFIIYSCLSTATAYVWYKLGYKWGWIEAKRAYKITALRHPGEPHEDKSFLS